MNTAQIEWARTRIRSTKIVNGKYELDVQRETNMGNLLFIPGLTSPVAELRQMLFSQGQPGGGWIPSFSQAMIAANSFGSGVTDILDLSGNNNPFSQATPSSRGALFREPKTGARQLLANSGFLGAVSGSPGTAPTGWTRGGSPVGTQTYNPSKRSIRIAVSGQRLDNRQSVSLAANTTYHFSAIANVFVSHPWFNVFNVLSPPAGATITYQQDNDSATTNGNLLPAVRNDTVLKLTIAVGATSGSSSFAMGGGISGSGTSDIEFWDPQVEIASARSAYQLSGLTLFDVTEAGQRDCYGVRADGIDDFYTTASIDFTGTDKVTVFAAVRKLTDLAFMDIASLSANYLTTDGTFSVGASGRISGLARDSYFNSNRGTSLAQQTYFGFTAPHTAISTTEFRLDGGAGFFRVNGNVETLDQGGTGTGTPRNYRSDVMYLFRQGGISAPFNGDLYALIVAGGSYPLSTIQRVERLLSRITPTVNL
jgi:hypothetical protein